MSSFSLANRTKVVPSSSYLETSFSSSSHEPSDEYLYTSQEGLAFHTPPSVTDACHFALSPEPIRAEEEGKVEPKQPSQPPPPPPHRQSSDNAMVVRRKGSANSSGDVATPPPPQAKKKKYTRAFSHRARTGCMTCRIRHKKCDEERPTCRRCAAANVVCDGYPSAAQSTLVKDQKQQKGSGSSHSQAVVAWSSSSPSTGASSPTSSTRSGPSSRRTTPLFTINPIVFESATEARYFHHFRMCTRFGLAESAGLLDFWDAYALPIAHQEDYLRQTIAAVGAAHQLFVIRSYSASDPSTWDTEQENAAIQQYNRAISSLVRAMSTQNTVASTHGALLCCLMFVTFESLLGRYSESIKHIQSGFQLLASLDATGKITDPGLWQQTYDMFARLGLEFSAFMDAPLTPALPSNMPLIVPDAEDLQHQPFSDLNEAMYALRTLDIGHFTALHEAEQQHLITQHGMVKPRPPTPDAKVAAPVTDPYAQGLPRGTSRSPVGFSNTIDASNNSIITTTTFGPLWEEHWNDRFYAWGRRFELTVQAQPADLSDRDRAMLARLRLQQSFWKVAVELSKSGGSAAGVSYATCEECLARAEELAAPFLAAGKPTFSLDGDLISDLSFITSVCRDQAQQDRAMRLLRSLNRREGIWDSREIAEMHDVSIRLGVANIWGEDEELGCSVPAFMRSLARMSSQAYAPRAALVSMADFQDGSTTSSGSTVPDVEEIYVV